jgi:hypothetical protein
MKKTEGQKSRVRVPLIRLNNSQYSQIGVGSHDNVIVSSTVCLTIMPYFSLPDNFSLEVLILETC